MVFFFLVNLNEKEVKLYRIECGLKVKNGKWVRKMKYKICFIKYFIG